MGGAALPSALPVPMRDECSRHDKKGSPAQPARLYVLYRYASDFNRPPDERILIPLLSRAL